MKLRKVLNRAVDNLVSHGSRGHKIRVQLIPGCEGELEMYCVFCRVTLMMGSPGIVNDFAQRLVDLGYDVTKSTNSVFSVRVH